MNGITGFVNSLSQITFPNLLFYLLSCIIIIGACVVTFSRNIVHAGFALFSTFIGVAGLYGLLTANFIAAVQILVYVGGVLVIVLFAIMLTRGIQNSNESNLSSGLLPAVLVGALFSCCLISIAVGFRWSIKQAIPAYFSVTSIGKLLLDKYLIPFEVLSLILLAVLIGSVMVVRKEIKSQQSKEVTE